MSDDLERFRRAQATGLATAVRELRSGRKRSHWIWYVFPQLRGLGSSSQALLYGLDGIGEARAYLGDQSLQANYLEVLRVVHSQMVERGAHAETLMGSWIDAKKLVSSLTLFEYVARTLDSDVAAREGLDEIDRLGGEVLAAAERQGFPPCDFTLQKIRASAQDNEHARGHG